MDIGELEQLVRSALDTPIRPQKREILWTKIQTRLNTPVTHVRTRRLRRTVWGFLSGAAALVLCGYMTYVLTAGSRSKPADMTQTTFRVTHVVTPVSLEGIDLVGDTSESRYAPDNGLVTPDGNWIYTGSHVESLSGGTYPLPFTQDHPTASYTLQAISPEGDIIFGLPANNAPTVAFNPLKNSIIHFPLAGSHSAMTVLAAQSTSDVWATLESNSSGAGPNQTTWVAINGQKAQGLEFQDTPTQMAWSPDGKFLAVVNDGIHGPSLFLYDLVRRAITSEVPLHVPAGVTAGFPNSSTNRLQWSSTGEYVVIRIADTLVMLDIATGNRHDVHLGQSQWAWAEENRLWLATPDYTTGNTDIQYLDVSQHSQNVVESLRLNSSVRKIISAGTAAIVETSDGRLVYIDEKGRMVTLQSGISLWWYSSTRKAVYVAGTNQPSTLWEIPLPNGGVGQ
jgi:hypothetical protein